MDSFARRLGLLFHTEAEVKDLASNLRRCNVEMEEDCIKDDELASTEPLITPHPSQNIGSFFQHANHQATPVLPPLHHVGESSPFVLVQAPQVEIETEADISLEEAEEARESPLHKRLSMSLITCHEGATSTQIFAEVHHDSSSSPAPGVEVEPLGDGIDICPEPECPNAPVEPPITSTADVSVVPASPEKPDDAGQTPCSVETDELVVAQDCLLPEPKASELPTAQSPVPSQEQPLVCTGIRCPNFNSKSPSQVVFKPQWLVKGFGAPGLRARGVQGRVGKGGSSPLAVQVAVKNAVNENKALSAKLKQKGV